MAGGTQSVLIIGGGIMGGDIAIIFAAGNRNVHVHSAPAVSGFFFAAGNSTLLRISR